MIQQAKAKIFLSDQRGLHETNTFRSRHTFNCGNYFNEHKQPFGNLVLLNDHTLAGGATVSIQAEAHAYTILIPVMGAIACTYAESDTQLVAAGQVHAAMTKKDATIQISNPFPEEYISYLHLLIRADNTGDITGTQTSTYDDVNENINKFVSAIATGNDGRQLPFILSIGKFSGRGETTYISKNRHTGLFLFVIAGAFEAEGRLLHTGDGLALWNNGAAEMEALSNDAIMMILELPQAYTA